MPAAIQVDSHAVVSARQLKPEVVVMALLRRIVSAQGFVRARSRVFALALQRAFAPAVQIGSFRASLVHSHPHRVFVLALARSAQTTSSVAGARPLVT